MTYSGGDNTFKQCTLLLPLFVVAVKGGAFMVCMCVHALGTVINAKCEVQITHRTCLHLTVRP